VIPKVINHRSWAVDVECGRGVLGAASPVSRSPQAVDEAGSAEQLTIPT
jgi:hypothetical protein